MPEDRAAHHEFASFLSLRVKERGVSLARLSELSGISPENLTLLLEGDFAKLPPAPYLRGYLAKLGKVLNFDGDAMWESVRGVPGVQSSASDARSRNRFALAPGHRYAWIALLGAVILGYLAIRLPAIIGEPRLSVLSPADPTSAARDPQFRVAGTVDRATDLLVNGEKTAVINGSWERTVVLEPGLNTIEIRAKKFLGRETAVVRQVVYEPEDGR